MTRKSSSVTIRDVARQAEVSVATVSRYLNSSGPVSDQVAEKLDQVMADLKYVPQAAARQLATRRTRLIGVLLTNLDNDFFSPLLRGIEEGVRSGGYNLLVATYHAASRDQAPPPIGPHNIDGLLVFADSLDDKSLAALHHRGFPLVLIHRTPPEGLPIPCVTVENKAATRRLIEHLIEVHGKRRILLMRGESNQEDAYWREIGFRDALSAHGLEFDPQLVLRGEFDRDIAYQSLKKHLENGTAPFDAIFTGDDDAAIGVMRILIEKGYRVPEDVAVVGFDDMSSSAFLTPPLTTVRAPTEQVGRIAAQQLINLLAKETTQGTILLPTEIILRRSCGCS
jgi:DNA-binding LacI/PurR family transcriptional regulator